jgi:hypothetical protein
MRRYALHIAGAWRVAPVAVAFVGIRPSAVNIGTTAEMSWRRERWRTTTSRQLCRS